jgi:flagellar assembly factor FliW
MIVNTSRFGPVEVDEGRVITFPRGMLGFARFNKYVLIQPNEEGYFFWLQSTEAAELAFVVTDPSLFVRDYRVALKPEQIDEMGLDSVEEAQVLVIVNKRGTVLTGNLQGPLVINTRTRQGEQLVLSDRRFSTRVPLLDLGSNVAASA